MCHLTNLWGSEMWTLDQNERCLLAAPLRAWRAAWFLFCTVSTRRKADHSQHQCVYSQHLGTDSPAFSRVSSLSSRLSLLEWQKRMMEPSGSCFTGQLKICALDGPHAYLTTGIPNINSNVPGKSLAYRLKQYSSWGIWKFTGLRAGLECAMVRPGNRVTSAVQQWQSAQRAVSIYYLAFIICQEPAMCLMCWQNELSNRLDCLVLTTWTRDLFF